MCWLCLLWFLLEMTYNLKVHWQLLHEAQIKNIESEVSLKLRTEWASESALLSIFAEQLGSELFANILFNELRSKQLMRMRVVCEDTLYFEVENPLDVEFSADMISEPLRWSRFTYMHSVDGSLVIELPSQKSVVGQINPLFSALLLDLNAELDLSPQQSEAKNLLLNYLLTAGFVTRASDKQQLPEWEFHDRLFYSKTTLNLSVCEKGKRSVFPTTFEMPQLVKPHSGANILPLPTSAQEERIKLNKPFSEVLNNRRSQRKFDAPYTSLSELSLFLETALKIHHVKDNIGASQAEGYSIGLRPSPSAGALHSLEVYVSAHNIEGLDKGIYHYCPLQNELEKCSDKVNRFHSDEMFSTPHAELIITSRIARTSFKYTGAALRLILLDLGCMLQTMMLTAEALDLKSYIVGIVDQQDLIHIPEVLDGGECVVGKFIIGK